MTPVAACLRPRQIFAMLHARRKTMRSIKPVVAALVLLVFASSVSATTAQTYPVECAQRDVQGVLPGACGGRPRALRQRVQDLSGQPDVGTLMT